MDDYDPESTVIAEKVMAIPIGGITQVCENNPRRVALGLASFSGSSFFATQPATLGPHGAGSNPGGFINTAQPVMILTVKLHGVLPIQGWFVSNPTTADVITVFEVLKK